MGKKNPSVVFNIFFRCGSTTFLLFIMGQPDNFFMQIVVTSFLNPVLKSRNIYNNNNIIIQELFSTDSRGAT